MLEILNTDSYKEEKARLEAEIRKLQQRLDQLKDPVIKNVHQLFNSLVERKDVDPIVRFFCWYVFSYITGSEYNNYGDSTEVEIWRNNEDFLVLCGFSSFKLDYLERHREYSILEMIGDSFLEPICKMDIRLEEKYSYNGKYLYVRPFENFPINEEIEKKIREYLVGQLEMLGAADLVEEEGKDDLWVNPFDFLFILWTNFHVLLSYNYWVSFYPRPSDSKHCYNNSGINFEVGCKMPNEIKEMEGHLYLLDYMKVPNARAESSYPNYWSCIDRVSKQVESIFIPFIKANVDRFEHDW